MNELPNPNFLSIMLNSAGVCFTQMNHISETNVPKSDKRPRPVYVPHQELLHVINPLLSSPIAKWEEGYEDFVTRLSSNNEALDSWCKLMVVFTAGLGRDYTTQLPTTMDTLFSQYAAISDNLRKLFYGKKEITVSETLAFLLCVANNTTQL